METLEHQLRNLQSRRQDIESISNRSKSLLKEQRKKSNEEMEMRMKQWEEDNEKAKIRNIQLIDDIIAAAIQAKVDIAAITSSSSSSLSSSLRKLKEAKHKYYQTADHLLPSWKQMQIALKEQDIKKLQSEKVAASQRRKTVMEILEKEEEIKSNLEQERRGLVLALALEQRDQLQAKALSVLRQEESKRVDDAILNELTKTGKELNDLIITEGGGGGRSVISKVDEANSAVAHLFGITDNMASLIGSQKTMRQSQSSPKMNNVISSSNRSDNNRNESLNTIPTSNDSNSINNSSNHTNTKKSEIKSPLSIEIPPVIVDSPKNSSAIKSEKSESVIVNKNIDADADADADLLKEPAVLSLSSPISIKTNSKDEYRERTGSISTIVSDVVVDPLSPQSPVVKTDSDDDIYPASSKLLQSPRNTPTTTTEDSAHLLSKSTNPTANTDTKKKSGILDLASANDDDIVDNSEISTTACVDILRKLYSKIEEIAENNVTIKIYEPSSLSLDRAVANFIANAASKNMIAELDAYGMHHYTGTVITIIRQKGAELVPEEALNGVVTVERLKKILKKNGFGPSEIWSCFSSHLQTLLKIRPMQLQELQDVFTKALIEHITDSSERQRIERKVSKLVGLSILPEGLSRSPSPPNRTVTAQSYSPTVNPGSKVQTQRMTFGTLYKSAAELDEEEFAEDEEFEQPPALRDLAPDLPLKKAAKRNSTKNLLESSSEFDF